MSAVGERGTGARSASRGRSSSARSRQSGSSGSSGQSRQRSGGSRKSTSAAKSKPSRTSGSSGKSSKAASASGRDRSGGSNSSGGSKEAASRNGSGTLVEIGVPLLSAGLGVAGGILLGRTALQRNRKILGIPVSGKVDFSGVAEQVGEAARQFGKLAGEVRTVREKAEQIGRALS